LILLSNQNSIKHTTLTQKHQTMPKQIAHIPSPAAPSFDARVDKVREQLKVQYWINKGEYNKIPKK
jgi:hypothetical protein